MKRTHIRTYMIAEAGDIRVSAMRRGESIDLSAHYGDEKHDRRHTAVRTTLDVFRREDDRLAWALSPTGHDMDSAGTVRLLLNLFVEDSEREPSDPRAM